MRRALVVAVLVLLLGTVVPEGASAQAVEPWDTVELLPLVAGHDTEVRDINNAGVSVGASGANMVFGLGTPVRWSADGTPTALPVPEGCTFAAAVDISNTGLIVGSCAQVEHRRPLRWNADGTLVDIPATVPSPLPNEVVSDTGYVAGSAFADGRWRPAVQAFAGGPVTLLADAGSPFTVITGLTSYGYLVGNVRFLDRPGSEFVPAGWIGPYVFPLSLAADAWVVANNEPGYALLEVRTPNEVRGVLVGPRGHVIELHSTTQDLDEMVDINNRNIVLGFRGEGANVFGALFGTTGVVRLEDLAADADAATWARYRAPVALNDDAWMVGVHDNGTIQRSWLLRPPAA